MSLKTDDLVKSLDSLAENIQYNFTSANYHDRNLEYANLADTVGMLSENVSKLNGLLRTYLPALTGKASQTTQ